MSVFSRAGQPQFSVLFLSRHSKIKCIEVPFQSVMFDVMSEYTDELRSQHYSNLAIRLDHRRKVG